jgi:hypothetical protein
VVNQTIRSAELRKDRGISFHWNPVTGADGYIFTLYTDAPRPEQRRQILRTAPLRTANYTLDQLSLLDRGNFIWQVEAVQISPSGTVTNIGTPGENRFVIDAPAPAVPRVRDPGILYGPATGDGETNGE